MLENNVLAQAGVRCYVNLLVWEAVGEPDYATPAPSLPLSGGLQSLTMGHSVFRSAARCHNPP